MKKKISFLSFLFFGFHIVQSQSMSSIFSNNGIGIPYSRGLTQNIGMGEVGLGVPHTWQLNVQNPAFLPFNKLTILQMGIEMDFRNISGNNASKSKNATGFRYLNFSLPIIEGKWTSSFGLNPYSLVNTKTFSEKTLQDNSVAKITFEGVGGLSGLHWSNGVYIGKNIYLGFSTTYIFGAISQTEVSEVYNKYNAIKTTLKDQTKYNGMTYTVATGYRYIINESQMVNLGIHYDFETTLKGEQELDFELNANTYSDKSFQKPASIGLGLSYQILNKIIIAADFNTTQWKNGGLATDEFSNTLSGGIGVEWTPDNASINKYYKRISYRFGINAQNLPYKINKNDINEFGINFGVSLPVKLSSVDIAMKYGRIAGTGSNTITENFFRIVFGATLNTKWFIKRRYD